MTVKASDYLMRPVTDVIHDRGRPRPVIRAGLRAAAMLYEAALGWRARYDRHPRRRPVVARTPA